MMRNYVAISLFTIVELFTNCNKVNNNYDNDVVVIVDITDRDLNQITPEAIINHLNLESDIWQGIRLKISLITHRDYNPFKVLIFPKGNNYTDNKSVRRHTVSQFKKQIVAVFDSLRSLNGTLENSVIYRNLATELNLLSGSNSQQKEVIIASDLMEHSDFDFYDKETMEILKTRPDIIENKLDSMARLNNVTGIRVRLVYSPDSYENNKRYRVVHDFYNDYLTKHGIIVSTGIDLEK